MRRWKAGERLLAARLGAVRQPITGRIKMPLADLLTDHEAIEVKTRRRMPVFLARAMLQACRGADYHGRQDGIARDPIVIIHADGQSYDNALVVMRLSDYERLRQEAIAGLRHALWACPVRGPARYITDENVGSNH